MIAKQKISCGYNKKWQRHHPQITLQHSSKKDDEHMINPSKMFNFIIGEKENFESDVLLLTWDCIFAGTEDEIKKYFLHPFSAEKLIELYSLPTVFISSGVYDPQGAFCGNKIDQIEVGFIKKIYARDRIIGVKYKTDSYTYGETFAISLDNLNSRLWRFNINENDLYNSEHWSVKNGDLFRNLVDSNAISKDQYEFLQNKLNNQKKQLVKTPNQHILNS